MSIIDPQYYTETKIGSTVNVLNLSLYEENAVDLIRHQLNKHMEDRIPEGAYIVPGTMEFLQEARYDDTMEYTTFHMRATVWVPITEPEVDIFESVRW